MDLRIKKTKRAIRSAFAELIKEKPMEKITVKEICTKQEKRLLLLEIKVMYNKASIYLW